MSSPIPPGPDGAEQAVSATISHGVANGTGMPALEKRRYSGSSAGGLADQIQVLFIRTQLPGWEEL